MDISISKTFKYFLAYFPLVNYFKTSFNKLLFRILVRFLLFTALLRVLTFLKLYKAFNSLILTTVLMIDMLTHLCFMAEIHLNISSCQEETPFMPFITSKRSISQKLFAVHLTRGLQNKIFRLIEQYVMSSSNMTHFAVDFASDKS